MLSIGADEYLTCVLSIRAFFMKKNEYYTTHAVVTARLVGGPYNVGVSTIFFFYSVSSRIILVMDPVLRPVFPLI